MLRPRRAWIASLALLAAVLIACSGSEASVEPTSTPTAPPEPTATATATPRPTSTPTSTPAATPTPESRETPRIEAEPTPEPVEPVIRSIAELVAEYGEPPHATYGRLRIPVLGIDAPVGAYRVDPVMIAPANPIEVAWYDMANYPGMGGAPGEGRNAIFSAHVDYAARVPYAGGAAYRGKGIFIGLGLLSPGDVIEIEHAGQVYRYAVTWKQQLNAGSGDWGAIWSDDVEVDSITIYTCGGDFDFGSRSYEDRVVVRAERI